VASGQGGEGKEKAVDVMGMDLCGLRGVGEEGDRPGAFRLSRAKRVVCVEVGEKDEGRGNAK
jgi:hypothetical protein